MNTAGFKKLKEEAADKDSFTKLLVNLVQGLAQEVDTLKQQIQETSTT